MTSEMTEQEQVTPSVETLKQYESFDDMRLSEVLEQGI